MKCRETKTYGKKDGFRERVACVCVGGGLADSDLNVCCINGPPFPLHKYLPAKRVELRGEPRPRRGRSPGVSRDTRKDIIIPEVGSRWGRWAPYQEARAGR